jgi:starvation-inducible DNA-binding protein
MHVQNPQGLRAATLATPTDLTLDATRDVAAGLNFLLADVFAQYLKTKNFHWHMSGPQFRDCHLLPANRPARSPP